MKKTIGTLGIIAISAILGLFLTGFSAYAQELREAPESDFNVILNKAGDGVVITKYTGKAAQVRIPAQIQGFPVKEIGEFAFDRGSSRTTDMTLITRIVIPEGVIVIERFAFNEQGITQLELPNTITSINGGAFRGCRNLVSVTLPSSLVNIGGSPYAMGSGGGVFTNCENLTTVIIPEGVPYIGIAMFENCRKLKEINLPSTIVDIRNYAFSIDLGNSSNPNKGLSSITFNGNNLRRIGENAFSGTNFTSFVFPEGTTELFENSFSAIYTLKEITLPSTIKIIRVSAFSYCTALTTVNVPDSISNIDFRVSRTISMTGERDHVFTGCTSLNLASQAALKKVGWGGM